MIHRFILLLLLPLLCFNLAFAQRFDLNNYVTDSKADSMLSVLTTEQKIGQLFMVAAYSNRDSSYVSELLSQIDKYHIGGVIAMQGGPRRHLKLINALQSQAKIPLLVGMDAEWGAKMRLDSVARFPYHMQLGAINDDSLIVEVGKQIGEQLRYLGVHINFAPVIDINNNPANPVINFRSFGADKRKVAWKGLLLAQGLQEAGIMAVAKHFPGHGDTDVDSHLGLPTIGKDSATLMEDELYPFSIAIDNGVAGVMVAHMKVPALDTSGVPTSLSGKVVNDLLKKQMGFKGLVFSDALNMKGVTSERNPGQVAVEAFLAGNDVLLFPEDIEQSVLAMEEAVQNGIITMPQLDSACKKILLLKDFFNLTKGLQYPEQGLYKSLNAFKNDRLNHEVARQSITVVKGGESLPLKGEKIVLLNVYKESMSLALPHITYMKDALKVRVKNIAFDTALDELENILFEIDTDAAIVVMLHDLGVYASSKYGINDHLQQIIDRLALENAHLVVFGNPYCLSYFSKAHKYKSVIVTYQQTPYTCLAAAQVLTGSEPAMGVLPVDVDLRFKLGDGQITDKSATLSVEPYLGDTNLHNPFSVVDSIAEWAIRERATPGCQVLAIKGNRVLFDKSYGYFTYDSLRKVDNQSVYDLASLTKVLGATLGIMKLYEQGKIELSAPVERYMPEAMGTPIAGITIEEILLHQAGFKSWIPFWKSYVNKRGNFRWRTFKDHESKNFNYQVDNDLYAHKRIKDDVLDLIFNTPLEEKIYRYSDLGFYLLPIIIENISGKPFFTYMEDTFYRPMGIGLTFTPLRYHRQTDIVPTEYDSLFRKELLRGYVHDEGAALMDRHSSNAGLFGNASDVAAIFEMLMNGGVYNGIQYLDPATINTFKECRKCAEENRRALGFDRPLNIPHANGNTAVSVSQNSIGHSGFTGTFVWADWDHQLVYVFLSNRVYPSRDNNKLGKYNVRTNIQEAFYQLEVDK